MRKLSKTAKDSKEGDMMKLGVDPGKKDFSDLQMDQMLKKLMIEQLALDENNFANYNYLKAQDDLNAVLHVKDETENPIIRLDGVLEYNAKQVFDTIVSTELMA